MAFLAVLLLACFVGLNYLLHRDVLYPGFLQATLWLGAVSLFLVSQETFIPVRSSVFIVLVAGVFFFSVGAFTGSLGHTPYRLRNQVDDGTLPSKAAATVLAAVVVLGLIPYLSRVYYLSSFGPFENAFINLRYNVSVNQEETGGIGRVSYFVTLSYVLAGVTLLRRLGVATPQVSRGSVVVVVLLSLVFGILSSGRGPVLALIIVLLAIPAVLRATAPVKTGAILAGLSLLLFISIGVALGKGGTVESTLSENWPSMRESFVTYSVGGIPALGTFLANRGPDVDLGLNSFRSVFAVLETVGLQRGAAPLVQPYIDVPMPTNVYTVYQPYIKDFGTVGALPVLFVLGFIHAEIYRRATVRRPHAMFVFLYGVSLFPLVMQAFQDMYFSLLAMWVQYAVYAAALFWIFSERQGLGLLRYRPFSGSRTGGDAV